MMADVGDAVSGPRLRLYLAHHADAVGIETDPSRPLSALGQRQVAELAREAAVRGVKPTAVWHSGKLRARQTAEAYWRACNPLAQLAAVRGLQPDDPPAWLADRLLVEEGELMAVGHMPHLARLLRLILTGDADASHVEFPLHGLVCVEEEDGAWRESWRLATLSASRE
jgi:phosphohistidine phosphatase